MKGVLFEVATPLGVRVRCSHAHWGFIAAHKHPVLAGREVDIALTLEQPAQVRRSRKDPDVLLFYRQDAERWLCGVVRRENATGFLITAYPTDAIKMGVSLWTRSE